MSSDSHFWSGRRVLLTGHTGFKGAWLALWLQSLGAELTGLSRGVPTSPSLYDLADVGYGMRQENVDVTDRDGVRAALARARPEVVMHLAAQPMVRRSVAEPAATYAVNVMGTVNVLDAVRLAGPDVRAVVIVTSDKCYENRGTGRAFSERDPLGGADPYSSSKAAAELVAAAYRATYFTGPAGPRIATARAGNVIGGGDWGEDRLLADLVRAVTAGEPVMVRSPRAVRPWQHVLCALSGYVLLAERLHRGDAVDEAWNFGPDAGDARPVAWIVERMAELWQGQLVWQLDERQGPAEAAHLELDCSRSHARLGWRPAWDLQRALVELVSWHRAHAAGAAMRELSLAQIADYRAGARLLG